MLQAVVAGGDVAVAGCSEGQARRAQGMAPDAAAGVVAGGPAMACLQRRSSYSKVPVFGVHTEFQHVRPRHV
jgi:hypothetical protein